MPQFVPIDALHNRSTEAATFELWLPNPIMGRALFLRLPLDRGWTFEFDPGEARASRFMVNRDRMWVRDGRVRFFAIQTGGSRVELNVMVKRWKQRIPECHLIRESRRWRFFRSWLGTVEEEVIIGRCCRTERAMRIGWKAEEAGLQSQLTARAGEDSPKELVKSDLEILLFSLDCH